MNNIDLMLEQFLLHCDAKNLSRKTLRSYDQTIRLFIMYLENECEVTHVKDIEGYHFKKYVAHLGQHGKYTVTTDETTKRYNYPDNRPELAKDMSDTTIANYLRNIKVFINWLYAEGEITKKLAGSIPKVKTKRKQQKLLSPTEIERLIRANERLFELGY